MPLDMVLLSTARLFPTPFGSSGLLKIIDSTVSLCLVQKMALLVELGQSMQLRVNQVNVSLDISFVSFLTRRHPVTQVHEGSADVELVRVDVLVLYTVHELGRDQCRAAEALNRLPDDVEAVFLINHCQQLFQSGVWKEKLTQMMSSMKVGKRIVILVE